MRCSIEEFSTRLVASITGFDPRAPDQRPDVGEVAELLDPQSRHRLFVYQHGYYQRLATNLGESVFERAALLFGDTRIKRLLVDYFVAHPPKSRLMFDSLDQLTEFCHAHPWTACEPHVIDVLSLSLARWRVLTGPDPTENPPAALLDPDSIVLTPTCAFVQSSAPLASLWRDHAEDVEIAHRSESVLIIKTSPCNLTYVEIGAEMLPLVAALLAGKTLSGALEYLVGVEEAALTRLIASISEAFGFHASPTANPGLRPADFS